MISVVLAALLALTPTDLAQKPWLGQVDMQGWTLVGITLKRDRVNLYRPEGDQTGARRRGWMRLEYEDPASGSAQTLYEFDCAAGTFRPLETANFPGRNLTGERHALGAERDVAPIRLSNPESPVMRALALACAPAS